MELPNADQAIVDPAKLRDYCLNPEHPRGRHKARVFEAVLGLTQPDAFWLQQQLLEGAEQSNTAEFVREDQHGLRYRLDFTVMGPVGRGEVRTLWLVPPDTNRPRLITCYVR